MISQCKKNYSEWGVEICFKKDKLYYYEDTLYIYSDMHGKRIFAKYKVFYNKKIFRHFSETEFEKYFMSEKNIRKEKLLKITEL